MATIIDKNLTIYRITVEDIYLVAESGDLGDEGVLSDEVVQKVIHKIEMMDFDSVADIICTFIEDAIKEVEEYVAEHGAIKRVKNGKN